MAFSVAVLGLGKMGGALAARLVRREHRVTGFDVSGPARDRARDEGVTVPDSASEAIAGADFVLSSLPTPEAVRELWLGADELPLGLARSACVVEASTVDPGTAELVAAAMPEGVRFIDCPVSGGPPEAREGRLGLMVGAGEEELEHARGFLAEFGDRVHHVGPVGAGKAVKLVNNVMSMANVLVAAEAFSLGVAYGIEPRRLFDILSVSGGASTQFVKRFPKILDGEVTADFDLALGTKDLSLALDFAHRLRSTTPLTALTRELFALAEAEGLGSYDHAALLSLYLRWNAPDASERTPEP